MKRRKSFIFLLAFVLGSVLVSCDTFVDNGTDDYTYTYTITFNANDGTANPATTTQTFSYPSSSYSASVILKANTFTRSGYTFVGWAYTDSKTADYEDGATATFSYDTTLYAVWKSDSFAYSYTITFEGNGGITSSGETKTTQVAAGDTSSVKVTLNPNPFAKSGYVFVGWSSYASSTSASYTDASSYSAYSNTTLYAVWESQVTVTLDANDGSGKTSKITTTKNSYIYFSSYADVFTQDYATLTGFNTQADGEGTDYSVDSMLSKSQSLNVTENTTLYANWEYNPCIIFNGNGGTTTDGITETKQYQDGHYEYLGIYWNFVPKNVDSSAESETVKLNGNPFTRDGYVFKGWSTSPSVGSPTYTDKQSVAAFTKYTVLFTIWSGKTLYAVWEKIPTITYNMNGGSNTDTFTVKSKSITDTVPSAKYSYYMFLGWSSSKNATTASYTSGDEYPYTTDTTLYAVWKLGTIFNSKAVSVARNSTETIGTFTLLKSESVKLTISNVDDALTYVATPASGTAVEFGNLSSATTVTKTLSAGTYTLTAKNAETIGFANTATVTLKGN